MLGLPWPTLSPSAGEAPLPKGNPTWVPVCYSPLSEPCGWNMAAGGPSEWNMAAGRGPCGGTWRLGGAPSEWNMAAGSGPCGRTWWLGACPVGGPGGERPQPGVPSLSGVLSGRHSGSSASRSLPTACWNEGAAHPPRLGLVPKGPGMNVGAQIRPRGHGEDPRVGGGGPEGLVNEKSRD